jgi:hypothetical protein
MKTLGLIGPSCCVLDEMYCHAVNDFDSEDNGNADALDTSRAPMSCLVMLKRIIYSLQSLVNHEVRSTGEPRNRNE